VRVVVGRAGRERGREAVEQRVAARAVRGAKAGDVRIEVVGGQPLRSGGLVDR
jgi:hypothetical protein